VTVRIARFSGLIDAFYYICQQGNWPIGHKSKFAQLHEMKQSDFP